MGFKGFVSKYAYELTFVGIGVSVILGALYGVHHTNKVNAYYNTASKTIASTAYCVDNGYMDSDNQPVANETAVLYLHNKIGDIKPEKLYAATAQNYGALDEALAHQSKESAIAFCNDVSKFLAQLKE